MRFLMILVLFSTMLVMGQAHAVNPRTYIPTKAYVVLPMIKAETERFKVGFEPAYVAASIEKESCLSLTHSRCFSSDSQLLTYWDKKRGIRREQGVGLGQVTRTWTRSGAIRFDTLTRLTTKYRTHLKGLTWNTIKERPDLQVRAKIFLLTETYDKLPTVNDKQARFSMTVSAYNSGEGRLMRDRRTCKLARNCNPDKWFGNVEQIKAPGFATTKLYGHSSAWALNRNHVREIVIDKYPKYHAWYASH